MEHLAGRAAVVTGAASGIGFAISDLLAERGVRVAMTDINADAIAEAASRVGRNGAEVVGLHLDVSDPDAVEEAAERVVGIFGGLHIAVNNAGILRRGLAWEITLEDWRSVLDVNLYGVIHGVRAFVPRILETRDEGHVVNVASMAAVLTQSRLGPYAVAKHGVLGLSDVLRADLAEIHAPVGVSVVFPGLIRTGMNPIGSVEPSEVALNVLDAIARRRSYVYTDDHSSDAVRERLEAIVAARADVIAHGAVPDVGPS